jgi:hypothetical protein
VFVDDRVGRSTDAEGRITPTNPETQVIGSCGPDVGGGEEDVMSDESMQMAGIRLVVCPTVVFGGASLLWHWITRRTAYYDHPLRVRSIYEAIAPPIAPIQSIRKRWTAQQLQNIPLSLAEGSGTTWRTSQCSTTFPSSSNLKMSIPA